jgi:hypothetical protein
MGTLERKDNKDNLKNQFPKNDNEVKIPKYDFPSLSRETPFATIPSCVDSIIFFA